MNELLAGGGCGVREDTDASFKYGHALLSKLRWIKSDSEIHIPVISYDHADQTLRGLGFASDRRKLKNLCLRRSKQIKELDDSNKVVRVWTLVSQPSVVSSLQDGASLLDLMEQPIQSVPIYGAAGSFGAQAVTAVTSGAASSSHPAAAGVGGVLAPTTARATAPTQVRSGEVLKPNSVHACARCPSRASPPPSADATQLFDLALPGCCCSWSWRRRHAHRRRGDHSAACALSERAPTQTLCVHAAPPVLCPSASGLDFWLIFLLPGCCCCYWRRRPRARRRWADRCAAGALPEHAQRRHAQTPRLCMHRRRARPVLRFRAPSLLLLLAMPSSRPPRLGRSPRRRYALRARSNRNTLHARPRCPSPLRIPTSLALSATINFSFDLALPGCCCCWRRRRPRAHRRRGDCSVAGTLSQCAQTQTLCVHAAPPVL